MFFVLKFYIIFLKVEWVHWRQKSGLCHIFIPTVMDRRFVVTETHNIQSKNTTKLHALRHKVLKWHTVLYRLTSDRSSLWREKYLGGRSSALFWLFFSLQRCALPRSEEDNGTGLALCLALVGCLGSCGIVPNRHCSSSHLGSSNIRQGLKC